MTLDEYKSSLRESLTWEMNELRKNLRAVHSETEASTLLQMQMEQIINHGEDMRKLGDLVIRHARNAQALRASLIDLESIDQR